MDTNIASEIPLACSPGEGERCEHAKFSGDGLQTDAHVTEYGRLDIDIREDIPGTSELVEALENQPALEVSPPSDEKAPIHFPLRMNIVIHVVGSRGDVQPFIAIGQALQRHGHRVRLATHLVFRDFVRQHGLEFFNIGGDPAQLMSFMVQNPKLIPKMDTLLHGAIGRRRKEIRTMIGGCWRACLEAGEGIDLTSDAPLKADPFVADAIIANPPSFAHIHCAEKMGIPLHMMFTMPWSPTQAFPHPLANIRASNVKPSAAKFASYAITEALIWQGLGDLQNDFRRFELGLETLDAMRAPSIMHRLQIPFSYYWSPSLLPKPDDWKSHIDVCGFSFLPPDNKYKPSADLVRFLEVGPPPIYIGFGSIVVDDPNALTKTVLDAVRLTGQRALISKGWGGLGADNLDAPDVFFLGNCPHDWLFSRVSCVVHHGGAGTTATGLALGRPTTIVPFFGDQPFWGQLVALNKAGPSPIPYTKLTAERLAEAIRFCLEPATIAQAEALSAKIRAEDGAQAGVESFHRHLKLRKLQCSLCPDRPAAWRVRRTKVLLSPFAATVLVQENRLQPEDIKLYHPYHYDVNHDLRNPGCQGAEGIAGPLTSFLSSIVEVPVNMVQNFAQPPSARFAEDFGLPSCDARASMITNSTDATSTTAVEEPANGSTTTSISDQSTIAASTTSSDSQDVPTMKNKHGFGSTVLANTSYTGRRFVNWIVQVPMGVTLGLSQGFHEAPRWYGDRMVREFPKVKGLRSGFVAAGKEFGYSLYDGVTGIVTQPRRGMDDAGVPGLAKGIGKGVGGLLLKPQAGLWGLFGYPLNGIYRGIERSYGEDRQGSLWAVASSMAPYNTIFEATAGSVYPHH
ncbi:conserved hypothetical protein [Aspergillus terreus NIH2624]|uniref:Uncharacterized protein n=1 Tax=Aspergillus terreus (strain NIH 2624 / FGSC A1156) TaxID=341663 RepID=Q0C7P5_ASPTN|nr:uncharacterized protein ATEG_10289 [Aspergillus terreus NIH2624]EAU29286.1 conserved hypothetical protein [Aspergillus terreus NIH2624]